MSTREQQEARAMLRASLTFAVLEVLICVLQSIVGGVIMGYVATYIMKPIYLSLRSQQPASLCLEAHPSIPTQALCIITADPVAALLGFIKCALYTLPVLAWIGWQYQDYVKKIYFRFRGIHYITIIGAVGYCLLHVAVLMLQRSTTKPFSLGNFIHTDLFRFTLAFDALVFSPLKEEFLFRVVLFNYFASRNPNSPVVCVLYSSFVFAGYHFVNSISDRFSLFYVMLQMCFAYFVGVFYGLLFVMRKNIWEPLLLHILNNVFASLSPLDQPLSLMSLEFLLNTVGNFVLHLVLLFLTLHHFERKWA